MNKKSTPEGAMNKKYILSTAFMEGLSVLIMRSRAREPLRLSMERPCACGPARSQPHYYSWPWATA